MDEPIQANAEVTTPATVPATAIPAAPAGNTPSTQNGQKTGSEVVDIDNLSSDALDQLSNDLRSHIPADAKGKALDKAREVVAKSGPAEIDTEEVVPPVVEPEKAPETQAEVPEKEVVPPVEAVEPEPTAVPDKAPQRRLRGVTTQDDTALSIYQNDVIAAKAEGRQPISMLEAALEADRLHKRTTEEDKPEPAATRTIEAVDTEINDLWGQHKAAGIEFDADKQSDLMRQISEKTEEKRDIREDAKARAQQAQYQVVTARQQSANSAALLYPDLATTGSAMDVAKNQIHDALVASNDPVISSADYPLHLAQLAAKQTQTPPKIAGKSPAPSKPVVTRSVQTAKPVAPLASATARTTTPNTGQAVAAQLDGMTDRQLDEVLSALPQHLRRS